MAKNILTAEQVQMVKDICRSHGNSDNELIGVLHQVQGTFGYLSPEVQELVANELGTSVAHVYGVVTFYSFFTMVPKGENHVSLCLGTACYVRGADKLLDEFKRQLNLKVDEVTPDGKFSLGCVRCVGACGLAPVVTVGEKVFPRLTPDSVKKVIEELRTS